MTKIPQLRHLPSIPVQVPRKMIFARLGYNKHKTTLSENHTNLIETAIAEAFSLCAPKGVWTRMDIAEHRNDSTVLEDGTILESTSLAKLLQNSHSILLIASTVGSAVTEAANTMIKSENAAQAVVFDAVGGQTAEAAITYLNKYIRQLLTRSGEQLTQRRYSPGYGDLALENQRFIFEILELDKIGLKLTERCLIIPEKSVTAVAGIEKP